MAKADYYDTLGANKGASDDELKKAYRKKAMKYHPDRNPDDKVAEQKFKDIGEAYEVLKDPQKRAAYDQMGHAAFEGGMGGGGQGHAGGGFGGFEGADFGSMFEEMFGDAFGGGGHAGPARGSDLRYNLTISLEDAFNGKTVEVRIPTSVECKKCDGSGAEKGTKPETCPTCNGTGKVRVTQGFFSMARGCPRCHGSGKIIKNPCRACHGSGHVQEEKTVSVNIPKGVDDGTRIRLSGEGDVGPNGGLAGDLYIFIQMKRHEIFQREGGNLHIKMPIDFVEAALGGAVEVPTVDGKKARLNIPEGTQAGDRFRLRGKGMPGLHGSGVGDLYVSAQVEVPTKLSKKQKNLLEDFRKESSTKNHPEQEAFIKKARR